MTLGLLENRKEVRAEQVSEISGKGNKYQDKDNILLLARILNNTRYLKQKLEVVLSICRENTWKNMC